MDLLSPPFPLVSYGAAKEAAKPEEKWGEGGGISPLVPTQDLYTPYHKGENNLLFFLVSYISKVTS